MSPDGDNEDDGKGGDRDRDGYDNSYGDRDSTSDGNVDRDIGGDGEGDSGDKAFADLDGSQRRCIL